MELDSIDDMANNALNNLDVRTRLHERSLITVCERSF